MNQDPLEQLLRDADAGAIASPIDVGLAQRVLARANRRRRTRFAVGTVATVAAAVACALAIVTGSMQSDPQPSPRTLVARTSQPAATVPDFGAELRALREDADRCAQLAETMWAAERRRNRLAALRRKSAAPDPLEQLDREIEHACFVMVYQADRMNDRMLPTPAAEIYRQVEQDFPDTRGATLARQRLAALPTESKG